MAWSKQTYLEEQKRKHREMLVAPTQSNVVDVSSKFLEVSAKLNTMAQSFMKMSSDLTLMATALMESVEEVEDGRGSEAYVDTLPFD